MEEEKIIYQDEIVKLTSMRITCNHVTVPISKINHVRSNLRVTTFSLAFTCFLLSFIPFYWYDIVPIAILGVVWLVGSLMWLVSVYKGYVELWINVEGRDVKILETMMGKRDYIYKIADELARTLIVDKKLEEASQKMDEEGFASSETMRLRQLVKQRGVDDAKGGCGITFDDEPDVKKSE